MGRRISLYYMFVVLSLLFMLVLTIPNISVQVQPINELYDKYYIVVLYAYNPSNSDVYNYSVRFLIPTDRIANWEYLCNGHLVTDLNLTPLNSWIAGCDGNYIDMWVKVPYVPKNSYSYVLLFYGRIITKHYYSDPHDVFLVFYDPSNQSEFDNVWSNTFLGIEYYDLNYGTTHFSYDSNGTTITVNVEQNEEYDMLIGGLNSFNEPIYVEFYIKPIGVVGRTDVGIVDRYGDYALFSFNFDDSRLYAMDSFYSFFYGDTGYYLASFSRNVMYHVSILSGYYYTLGAVDTYGNYIYNYGLLSLNSFNSFYIDLTQREVVSGTIGIDSVYLRAVYIRKAVYPDVLSGIVSIYSVN